MIKEIKPCPCRGEAHLFCMNGKYYVMCCVCGKHLEYQELSAVEAITNWNAIKSIPEDHLQ
jgi:hypothetical protein